MKRKRFLCWNLYLLRRSYLAWLCLCLRSYRRSLSLCHLKTGLPAYCCIY